MKIKKYQRNYNAFTLIELLAVIVILAVIAVISVPLISGIINDTKISAITDSVYGYRDAIKNYVMNYQTLHPESSGLKGSYTVQELKDLGIEVNGQEPNDGAIAIGDSGITGCLEYNEYVSYIHNNKVVNTTTGNCDGLYKSELEPGRLIYRGENPNNRIFLKENGTDTLYRIVSYEPDGTIKVVRDANIGDMPWDARTGTSNTYCSSSSNGCNVWGSQTSTQYNGTSLGDDFYYRFYESPTAQLSASDKTGKVIEESTLNKYLNDVWLPSDLSEYIDNHKFNVGGVYYFTDYSTGGKRIEKEYEEESLYTWMGKVGLMNITDYAQASLDSGCTNVWSNYYNNPNHSGWPCSNSNWTFTAQRQWALSPFSYYISKVWVFNAGGSFGHNSADDAYEVRPAFYLKSGINLSGTGEENNEFTIE